MTNKSHTNNECVRGFTMPLFELKFEAQTQEIVFTQASREVVNHA